MNFKLPLAFIQKRSQLTWREVQLGLQNGWLTDAGAIDLAIDRVTFGNDSPDLVELASVLDTETYKVSDIVQRLADQDPKCDNNKWLFLLLAWLYERRDEVEEPLAVIEELYADFDYPEEIVRLVRYMPAHDPSRVGEQYLFSAWRHYLDTSVLKYAPRIMETH